MSTRVQKKQGSAPPKRKIKDKKDPNKPKRPQSSYFIWVNEHREAIKEEFPGISITDISKKAGERWRKVTDRTKWEELAAQAKIEYQEAMEEYEKNRVSDSDDEPEEAKSKSKKRAKSSPKKKQSSDLEESDSD